MTFGARLWSDIIFSTGWVLAIYWTTMRYKTVYLIWNILFCNLLTCSVLHEPTFLVDIGHHMQCPSWLSALPPCFSWLLIFLVCPSFCFDCLSVSLSCPSALVIWSFCVMCSFLWRGGFLQPVGIQRVINQYALYVKYCFVTCWRVVCYTNPPSLWPSDTVCSARQSSVWLDWLSALSVCFSDLVIFVWWLAFLTGWVLAIYWNTACYKIVCLIFDILFCNLLTCSVLHEPTFLVAIGHRMQCPSVISLAWLIVCLVCLL